VLFDAFLGVKPFNIQSMTGMIFVSGLFLYSFVFLTLEGALASIDGSYEEAARIVGAKPLFVITRVTLPLVTPAIISASVFSLIISWGLFAVPAILGMPSRIFVFSTQLYLFLNEFPPKLEQAAAMGVIFCLTAFVIGMAVWLFRKRTETQRYAVVSGKGSRPALLSLGRAKPLAFLFACSVTLLSVLVPYAVILWMSLKTNWYGVGGFGDLSLANFTYVATEYSAFWKVIGNTLKVSALEAAIVLVVAGGVSYLAHRSSVFGRTALVAGAYYTILVPSVAFLSGVIWAWVGSPLGLYGGLTLIALTQAARSLPIATRNLGDGFRQIDRALEEAATICGAGRWKIVSTINLPLLRPVILSTFAIVFLSSLRELNTPLFLGGGTPDSMTLSVLIFQFWSESRTGESAALTIILLLFTLLIFLPFSRFFRQRS
jgi:iron(III) transport system permease protein